MANMHQEGVSIENMQVLSSNRVHYTHSCEANRYRIFKPFFCLSDIRQRSFDSLFPVTWSIGDEGGGGDINKNRDYL